MYYNAGLILEGGGMRGVYTAGVLDGLMDHDIDFMSIYGVSAGACHAASYMSKQRGRAFRVNVNYLNDPRYLSAKSYLKTGDLFGADMLYSQIPNVYDPFDYPAFDRYAGCLYAGENAATARAIMFEARNSGCNLYDASEPGADAMKLRNCASLIVFLDKAFLADDYLTGTLIEAYQSGRDLAVCKLEKVEEKDLPPELKALRKMQWLDFAHGINADMSAKLANQFILPSGIVSVNAILMKYIYKTAMSSR